jgi:hypothetical protein
MLILIARDLLDLLLETGSADVPARSASCQKVAPVGIQMISFVRALRGPHGRGQRPSINLAWPPAAGFLRSRRQTLARPSPRRALAAREGGLTPQSLRFLPGLQVDLRPYFPLLAATM